MCKAMIKRSQHNSCLIKLAKLVIFLYFLLWWWIFELVKMYFIIYWKSLNLKVEGETNLVSSAVNEWNFDIRLNIFDNAKFYFLINHNQSMRLTITSILYIQYCDSWDLIELLKGFMKNSLNRQIVQSTFEMLNLNSN